MLVLLLNTQALADQFDTVYYSVSAGVVYDDNVFRLPPGVNPLQAIGRPTKSDQIQTESAAINLDKKYSNQEVQFKANVTNNKYNTFSQLDYVNTTYNAAWNWSFTPKFNGSLSDSRTQTLNSFTDIHVYTRNLTTVDTPHLDADWWIQSNWHLTLGATDSKTTSTLSVINNQSYTSQVTEWGVKYTPPDGSLIAFVSRNIRNQNINSNLNYLLLADTENTETQKELDVNWQLTEKSALSGNLLYVNHKYPVFNQRDYSGNAGGVNFLWGISDKTNINFSVNRTMGSWFDFASSYYITNTESISPNWQISAKTNVRISISQSRTNFYGAIRPFLIARNDQIQSDDIGIDWTPQRSVKLSASMQNSRRSSNNSSYEYGDKSANLFLQVTF